MLGRRCSGSLYEALSIAHDASPEDVKRAYRKLALQLHPDKTQGTTTTEFQKIQEANAILSDPEMRKQYDTFGREGMKQLGGIGIPPELVSAAMIRLALLLSGIIFLLLLIWTSLLVACIDQQKGWNMGAVWSPLWILLSITTLMSFPMIVQGVTHRNADMVAVGLVLILTLVCHAAFVAGLQGSLSWSRVAVPFFMVYAIEMCRSLLSHRFSKFKEFHTMFPSPQSEGMEGPCHPFYVRAVVWEVWRQATTLTFMFLLYARACRPSYATLSFFTILSPILLRLGVAALTTMWTVWTTNADHMPPCRKALWCVAVALVGVFPTLFTVCTIASKAQSELNGDEKAYDPSAGVCAIFLFIAFGFGTLGSCVAACCAPMDMAEAGNPYFRADADGGEDGGAAGSSSNPKDETAGPSASAGDAAPGGYHNVV